MALILLELLLFQHLNPYLRRFSRALARRDAENVYGNTRPVSWKRGNPSGNVKTRPSIIVLTLN
jgi:hypothetical protein